MIIVTCCLPPTFDPPPHKIAHRSHVDTVGWIVSQRLRRWPNFKPTDCHRLVFTVLMLGQRLRRWPNIETTLVQRLVSTGLQLVKISEYSLNLSVVISCIYWVLLHAWLKGSIAADAVCYY